MDKLRRVLNGREDNEELGLTAQVNWPFNSPECRACCLLRTVFKSQLMVAKPISMHSANELLLPLNSLKLFIEVSLLPFVFVPRTISIQTKNLYVGISASHFMAESQSTLSGPYCTLRGV